MHDIDKLRLFREQLETEGTLTLGVPQLRWLFEAAAVGLEQRREAVVPSPARHSAMTLAIVRSPRKRGPRP